MERIIEKLPHGVQRSGESSSGLGDRELEFGESLKFSYTWLGLINCLRQVLFPFYMSISLTFSLECMRNCNGRYTLFSYYFYFNLLLRSMVTGWKALSSAEALMDLERQIWR